MRLETEAPSYANIIALIESNIEDILFDDATTPDDIYIANLFESFGVPNFKYDAMKSNFTYLCDLSFDNNEHFIEPYMSIFDIYSINTELFNMGTDAKSSHIVYLKRCYP